MTLTSLHSLFYVSGVAKVGHVTQEHIITSRPWVPMKNSDNLEPKIYRWVFPRQEKYAAGGYLKLLIPPNHSATQFATVYVTGFVTQFGGSDRFHSSPTVTSDPLNPHVYGTCTWSWEGAPVLEPELEPKEGEQNTRKKCTWYGKGHLYHKHHQIVKYRSKKYSYDIVLRYQTLIRKLHLRQPESYCSFSQPSISSVKIFFY